MAFPAMRRREVVALQPEDELLLYTPRGCFHTPTRDRGRIIGTARATSLVDVLAPPVVVAGREFALGCSIAIKTLVPPRQGVELAPLVSKLGTFPDQTSWRARMRRPLLRLPAKDASLLRAALAPVQRPYRTVADGYRRLPA